MVERVDQGVGRILAALDTARLSGNTLVVFMCLELMLVASTLALVAFSRFNGTMDGNVFVFFILTVAAAEVAVGLAIIVALFRRRQTISVDQLNTLKH